MLRVRKEVIQVIANLAKRIAYFLIKKGWGKEEECEIYQYGCEVIISVLVDILLVAVCGLLFHMTGKAFLFYAIFLVLRRYCGGFHAETYLVCNSVFTGIMLIALLGISYSSMIPIPCMAIVAVISFLIVIRYSPIVHKNKPLTEKEILLYRRVSIAISGLFLIMVFLIPMFNKEIAAIIMLAMLATTGTMIVSVIQRKEGEK